jgi:sugar phosphate isomerase/epimerase
MGKAEFALKLAFALSMQPTSFKAVTYGNWQKRISFLSDIGYDGIELAVREPGKIDKEELQKALAGHRMELTAIGTGQAFLEEGLSLSDKSPAVRKKTVARIRQHIELANDFGSQVIIGLIRGNCKPGIGDRGMHFLGESCKEICDYAANSNTTVTIEPINRYETCFLNTVSETVSFISKIGYERLKILLDTFHMNIEEKDICESIGDARGHISHMHFSDSNRKYPGAGHINFREIAGKIKEIGYRGYISAEILPLPNFEISAKEFLRGVRRAFKK